MKIKNRKLSADNKLESDIIIKPNALNNLGDIGIFDGVSKESAHFLITDKNIEKLYLQRVLSCIKNTGLSVRTMVVPANESSKSFETYSELVRKSLDHGFDEHSVIFSLGGGVINNIAGFLASTLYRGIGLIHLPTSLLAQVDAAIDFKQAINFEHGKNLIGSYYPASKIVIDSTVLQTLDIRFIRDGLAESIKHALCQDISFLKYIESNSENLFDQEFLSNVVDRSIQLKLKVMNDDLDEDYDETLKQYGHAVGHAIEHLSSGEIYHGEAISIGMCVCAEVGKILGVTDDDTVETHYRIFEKCGLPTKVPNAYSLSDIWEKVLYDKHFFTGKAYMGLLQTVGVLASGDDGKEGYFVDQEVIFMAIEKNRQRETRKLIIRKNCE